MKLKIPYFTLSGDSGEPITLEIDEKKLASNPVLISQALHVERNHLLPKPGLTKTKSEVSGGGKKPWKQKGTGRARAGSNRSPLWRGGGITFGPTKLKKILDIPKKMKEKAFLLLLIEKAKDNNLSVIESIKIENAKTKIAAKVLDKIAPAKQVIVAISQEENESILPWRNLSLLEIKNINQISLNDLNSKKLLLLTKKAYDATTSKLIK